MAGNMPTAKQVQAQWDKLVKVGLVKKKKMGSDPEDALKKFKDGVLGIDTEPLDVATEEGEDEELDAQRAAYNGAIDFYNEYIPDDDEGDSDEEEEPEDADEPESEPDDDEEPEEEGDDEVGGEEEEDDEPEEEEKPAKAAKSGGKKAGKAKSKDDGKKSKKADKEDKPAKKRGSDTPGQGPGVIQAILEVVQGATEDKPISKKEVHKALCKKFPDRDKDRMWGSVSTYVSPNTFRRKWELDLQVVDDEGTKRYYIAKSGGKKAKK